MNLQMSLKTKWFEMTKSGVKTEDYREINEYWFKRLCFYSVPSCYIDAELIKKVVDLHRIHGVKPHFKTFKLNRMTLGYPKSTDKERILIFEHAGIEIGYGNPEWGAEPNKLYFIIKHGKRIQ